MASGKLTSWKFEGIWGILPFMKDAPVQREIWFRTRPWYRGPLPIHWKGYLCYLLFLPPLAIMYFWDVLTALLKGEFPVLLAFLVMGCGSVGAFMMLQMDHLEPDKPRSE